MICQAIPECANEGSCGDGSCCEAFASQCGDYTSEETCVYPCEWVSDSSFFILLVLICLCCYCCCKLVRRKKDAGGAAAPSRPSGRQAVTSNLTLPLLSIPSIPTHLIMKPPPYWHNQDLATSFDEQYDSDARSETYKIVEQMIAWTFSTTKTRDRASSMPMSLRLLKVQRIEDKSMWCRYQQAKEAVQSRRAGCTTIDRLGPGGEVKTSCGTIDNRLASEVNEVYLWHGTTPAGALGISEDGFDLSRSGSHAGLMFGPGAYLAECSSKSDEYAQEGEGIYKGVYALILCRAVCGNMFYTRTSDIPAITQARSSGDFESVLGDREAAVGTYREFVVFDARLVYPEFVVLYTREF